MVSWLYKALFLPPSLSLSLCGSHHEVASGSVECIWHITFGSLLSNFCVCFGRHFGFVIYGHVKRSRSWSRAVIPLPLPSSLCVLSMAIRIRGLLHLTCGCDAGPEKVFTLISSYFFSHFIFRFLGFPFPFFFLSHTLCCPIGNCQTGREGVGWGAAEVNPMRPQKQIWIFANQAANLRGKRERGRQREARVANIGFGLKQPDQRNL